MTRYRLICCVTLLAMAATLCWPLAAEEADPFSDAPAYSTPTAAEVRDEVLAWLAEQQVDEVTLEAARLLWQDPASVSSADELLDQLAATIALGDEDAQLLVELCAAPRQGASVAAQDWLIEKQSTPLIYNNLRLLYGRWLSHEHLYDEALVQLADLKPDDVVDPAALLFFQSVAYHRLLERDKALASIEQLLNEVADPPRRYTAVAELMFEDLQALEDNSLDHIARRMEDIRRRLDLGRAGSKVRKVEDGVVASLDKLIEEMEKQQQQQQQQQQQNGGNSQPSRPAQDSQIMGGQGPGDVESRNIGSRSGWGELPPKQREAALQQIGKEFPSHYRDVIEQYFRRLAGRKENETDK